VCADVIAQHAGLNMAPASGGWVVGSREDIEQTTATIVGFAGEGHEARQEVWDMLASPEMRIILRSIVMYWGLGPEKTQIIRIALWQLEDGSGDWVVMVRHTGPSASRSRVLRLTALPGTRRFHCRWFSTADGFLASNFRKDLDGDGVPDLLWVGLHSNPAQWRVANFVLSGATGKVLLEFGGESLLVADDEFGEPLVTVAEYRGSHFYRDRSQESEGPVVLKPCLRDREFGFEPLTADSLEKRSESGSVQGGTTLVSELAAVAPRFSNPRLYLLPGQDPGGQMPGVRGIESPGWKEFAITESRAAAGNVEGLCDAVHCLTFLSYVPEQAARP